MVASWNPEGVDAAGRCQLYGLYGALIWRWKQYHSPHAVPSNKRVLQAVGQSVPAVQRTGHVRRRKGNNESFAPARPGLEVALLLPPRIWSTSALSSSWILATNPRGFERYGTYTRRTRLLSGSRPRSEGRRRAAVSSSPRGWYHP